MTTSVGSHFSVRIVRLEFLMLSIFMTSVLTVRIARYTYKQVAIIHELPTETDLDKYLRVLEKAMFFVHIHKYYADMHLSFGIFLTNGKHKYTFTFV